MPITLWLTGTVDRIDGDDAYCSVTDSFGNRGYATFYTSALAAAGVGVGDDFRHYYGTETVERLHPRKVTEEELAAIRTKAAELEDG